MFEAENNNKEDIEVLENGKPVYNREGYIPGTRKKKWGLISKYPIMDKNNRVTGVLANITDITKIKEFELVQQLIMEALSKSESILSIYDITISKVIFCTGSQSKFYGIQKELNGESLLKYWIENIVHPDDKDEQRKYIFDIPNTLPPERSYRIIHPVKGERKIKAVNYTIKNAKKEYIVSLTYDITNEE